MTSHRSDDDVNSSEPIIISALNQYAFCSRRCALMHIEGIWADNEHTTIGSLLHDHVDSPGYEMGDGVTILRALPLYSARYGLTGKADIVEMHGDDPVPVEYKKGRRRKFGNDEIQLCAQALCLEEMFCTEVPHGFIYHASSRRRREVLFEWRLREETLKMIETVRELLASGRIPPAELKPRCQGCSLRGTCLPELTSVRIPDFDSYQRTIWME